MAAPAGGKNTRELSADEFLNSQAAISFREGQYQQALKEFQLLETQYPKSTLIKRYLGITHDRLGAYKKAVSHFQAGLAIVPESTPLHYFLAVTYLHQQKFEEAKHTFGYVVEKGGKTLYRELAEKELAETQKIIDYLIQHKPRPWSINVTSGAEYNTNATYESRVPDFRLQEHQSAWIFYAGANNRYNFFKKGPLTLQANHTFLQSIYSDSLSQLNVTSNALGLKGSHVSSLYGRPLITQLAQTTSFAIVRDDYYSTTFAQTLTLLYSFANWHRIALTDRWSFTSYEEEGTQPDMTSRDGFRNKVQVRNYFYFNKKKNLYTVLGLNHQRDDTEGANFIKNGYGGNFGFHFPTPFNMKGGIDFSFQESLYPKFSFPVDVPERRHNEAYEVRMNLSKPLSKQWAIHGNYRLTLTDSDYDAYTYTNHALGFSVSYNY